MEASNTATHDLRSILTSEGRDFLIRNSGDKVKVDEVLKKGKVGLYFSAHWCGPCRRFTPKLADCYREVGSKGEDHLEVVFVSGDEGDDDFKEYFSEMPWLAVPFEDAATRDRLNELFEVKGIPHLVVLDGATGAVVTESGVEIVREHGAEGYPFTDERVKELQGAEEAARLNQTIESVLSSPTRDFVVTNTGDKVPVTELEGQIVGIYFSGSVYGRCTEFTSILSKIYSELKEKGESFEVVLASLDDDEKAFDESFQAMPWLALPFKDKKIEKLIHYFDLSTLPTLVIIGSDGKTLNANVAEIIDEHGIKAYPFSSKRLEELAELEKAKLESQTLESLLVTDDIDFVLGKNDTKVHVKELVGKTVLIYFSAHWCPPCRGFTPKLVEAYNKIKDKHPQFEVIFVSSDRDQNSFDEYYAEMPWLAIPFGDARKKSLSRTFKVGGIPSLIAIGPSGKTVNTDARGLVVAHGPDAYPFTEERLKELEEVIDAMVKKLPDTVKHELHEHELKKKRRNVYVCDMCNQEGRKWSFLCELCDFDLHPNCAFDGEKEEDAKVEEGHEGKEGYICEGDVCRKA